MRMPPAELSLQRLADTYGVYHLAQLTAHAKAELEAHPPKAGDPPSKIAALLATWTKLMTDLESQNLVNSADRRKRIEARAGLDLANLTADRFLGRLCAAVKADLSSATAKPAVGT